MNHIQKTGEWLEIHFAKGESPQLADVQPLLHREINLPPKLYKKLEADGGIQKAGNRVRVRLFPAVMSRFTPQWTDLDILYEDDYCMAVNKQAGVAIHPAYEGQSGTLANAVAGYYQSTGQEAAVRHIHRLDEDTTGPVLYAKNEYAHLLLDEAMRRKAIDRTYIAVVSGTMEPVKGRLSFPIGRDRHHNNRRRVSPTGEHAVTNYEVLERFPQASLVQLRLETGKTHQIRVHLSHIGHPIFGDRLYGGQEGFISRQALHGAELVFPHPLYKENVLVTAPWPGDVRELLKKVAIC